MGQTDFPSTKVVLTQFSFCRCWCGSTFLLYINLALQIRVLRALNRDRKSIREKWIIICSRSPTYGRH